MVKLQGLCKSESMPVGLYFRGDAYVKNDAIYVTAGGKASFNTYFNLFSATVWRKYAEVEKLTVNLTAEGTGTAVVVGFDNDPKLRKKLSEVKFSTDGTETIIPLLSATFPDLPEHIYVAVKADISEVIIKDITFETDDSCAHPVRVACSFCTFKREKELLENVRRVAGIENTEIYISDNGHTLSPEMFSGIPGIHLFQNKNYGGSSGFTRCMIEAVIRNGSFTHILLMDDDALIERYVVERTISLLSVLKPKYRDKNIGGAMLSLEQPFIQMENGAWINPKTWRIELPGRNYDLSKVELILENEKESRVDYNGWFYCCIPASFITRDNLPLPMFLHADDQEYGLRNTAGVIRMNGICIWHPNPWSKKRSYIEYYDARNGMIAMSRTNPGMPWLYAWARACITALRFMLVYRYDDAEYMLRGYEEYYKGPEWFKAQDPEKLNGELMRWKKQEEYISSRKEITRLINNSETEMESKKVLKILNMLLPAVKRKAIYDINIPRACVFKLCTKQFCVVDSETGKGYKLTKSYGRFFDLTWRLFSLGVFMAKNHKRIHREWSKQVKEIGTFRFWKHYLGLDGEEYKAGEI
ncbi:MAG: glycosyltransferase [Lachnospiraceae bacterium]|nr:glycosyltransferase [Lachnospiraceae bacterium]